ncbi:arginine--tRNA ligase [Candidatus Nomurabacteria bacterium]|nr:arginine--tRNA ligase [Candidatus Nomurabacteria bacterium]
MDQITKHIRSIVIDLFNEQVEVELTRTDEQFGDYSTNIAMRLSKKLGQNPRDLAQKIVDSVKIDDVIKAEVAGPGFINLTLSDECLTKLANSKSGQITDKVVVIETNNPNPFKAMHIGHAFNAILGDTIANLLEQAGNEVHRVSYHGDVGAHVGRSMYSILKYVGDDASKLDDIPESERNKFMSKMYAEGTKAYKDDPDAKAEIDKLSKQSFSPEGVYKQVYETCKKWSFDQIDELVKKLGNKPIERRYLEGQADALGVEIVKANIGDVFFENDGALVFPGSKYGTFDNVFVASTGRGLYGARDLGLMKLKSDDYHPDNSYIVTAEEQKDYFKGVIKAAELIDESNKGVTVNISTGTVKLSTGKMSSRSGDVLEIGWLFDQMAEAMKARGGQATDEFVSGALRYQFLKVKIGSDVVFEVEESVTLQGNSGPYLQYAHARASSILSKSESLKQGSTLQKGVKLHAGERSLLRKISEYNEVVERAVEELLPHYICTYLYELAQVFNRFYEKNKVIGDERESVRLQLVSMYAGTLKSGLDLLGIYAPEKM